MPSKKLDELPDYWPKNIDQDEKIKALITYVDYLKENIEKLVNYTEYLAGKLEECVESTYYVEFLTKHHGVPSMDDYREFRKLSDDEKERYFTVSNREIKLNKLLDNE